ncbi:hypothetical protein VNI00_003635 [Paramarasmius palmivorus]|uniref:MFS general substrate transporter n=1 Tax=Paramarasmius palmivorus TaxID=297713 RepID=A0AAW0DPV4_9AGAR
MSIPSSEHEDGKAKVSVEEFSKEDSLPAPGTPERVLAEKKLVRKLDSRVLPTIVLIFIMNYIDRNGITTARLKGLEEDLGLSDHHGTLEVASLLGGSLVTHSFGGLLACRIFIGLPEAAFYPGAIYLLSRWYTKKELAFRSAILYAGLLISNAFGALMAAGILSGMEGKRGIRAWRWLFFIESNMKWTQMASSRLRALLQLKGSSDRRLSSYKQPNNTRWITSEEKRLAQARLADDAGEADQDGVGDSPMKGLKMAIMDIKVPILAVMTISQLLGLSFVNFFPTLTATLGFNTTISLLLAAPPWIVATIMCCLNAWHADRTGERFFHIAGWWWGVILGFIIALSTMNTAARYIAMFFMACGYVGFSMTLVWVSNILPRPPAKRAAAIGIVNGCGNIGNLIGAFTWKSDWGPGYHQSMIISLAALAFSTALALVIRQMIIRDNRKLDEDEKAAMEGANRARVEEAARLEGITFEEAMARRRGFRYLY